MEKHNILVSELSNYVHPFRDGVWMNKPLLSSDVWKSSLLNNYEPLPKKWQSMNETEAYWYHCRRIAWMIEHHCHHEPLEIDVAPGGLALRIKDGNHRFAAALLRQDMCVDVLLPKQYAALLITQSFTP